MGRLFVERLLEKGCAVGHSALAQVPAQDLHLLVLRLCCVEGSVEQARGQRTTEWFQDARQGRLPALRRQP